MQWVEYDLCSSMGTVDELVRGGHVGHCTPRSAGGETLELAFAMRGDSRVTATLSIVPTERVYHLPVRSIRVSPTALVTSLVGLTAEACSVFSK